MLKKKIKAVIAGNYNQYLNYCKENKLNPRKDAIYINHPKKVLALTNFELVRYGEYWKNDIFKTMAEEKLNHRVRILNTIES